MNNFLIGTIVFIAGEIVAFIIFKLVKKKYEKKEGKRTVKSSGLQGMVERLVIFLGLLFSFPQILIAFSGLKIGTRFEKDKVSNEYFIVGNLLSIFIAISCAKIAEELIQGGWDGVMCFLFC
ncbi:MAG: hypothetical protein HN590_09125 [Calditrichaeota bacterium]|jgi:hypothetical protein|nr:hypothetical protein [Calditrichota bacterium]